MEQYAPTQSALEFENVTWNTTTKTNEARTFTTVDRLMITIFMPIIVTIGVTGNIAIIIVFLRIKSMRTSMNIYLASLALADLVFLTNAPVTIWKAYAAGDINEDSSISLFYCKLNTFLVDCSYHVSSLTILALTLERYFVVCWPLRFKTTNVRPIAIGATLSCWGLSLVWNSRKLAFTGFLPDTVKYEGDLVNVRYCAYYSKSHTGEDILHTIDAMLFFLIAIVIFILYFLMISMMQKMSRTQRTLSRSFMVKHRAQYKILRMLVLTVTVYIMCLSPFQILNLVSIHDDDLSQEIVGVLVNICRCLLYINSAANPFIYNVFNVKYREAFVECFCNFPGKKLSRTYTRATELSPRRTQTMLTKMNSTKSTTSMEKPYVH